MDDPWAAFVAARLDEDEAMAQAAVHRAFRSWHAEYEPGDGDYNLGSIEASKAWATTTLRHLAAAWSDHGDYPGTAVAP